jgi:hypothetical protein
MNHTLADVARFGDTQAVRNKLAEFGLAAPETPIAARRELLAHAERGGSCATFLFDLEAPVVRFAGSVQNRGAVIHKIIGVGQPTNGKVQVSLKPVGSGGDPVTVTVPAESLKDWTTISNAVVAATKGRVSSLAYPKSQIPGAPGLIPSQPADKNAITPEVMAKAAKAAGLDKDAISVLCRLATDGSLRKFGVLDIPGLMGRVAAVAVAQGLSGAAAVRAVFPAARFTRAAEFAPANADATGRRTEELPGGYRVVGLTHGSGPCTVAVARLDGTGQLRRIPVHPNTLSSWDDFASAVRAASGGDVEVVQPTPDEAAAIDGWPSGLPTAPVPTSNPATAGPQKNKNDMVSAPATPVAMSAAGPNEIDLATRRALASLQAKRDALSRTLSAAGVSAATSSSEAIRQAAEEAYWQVLRERSPAGHVDQVQAVIASQRRARLDEALGNTALGRQVLEDRQRAGRR